MNISKNILNILIIQKVFRLSNKSEGFDPYLIVKELIKKKRLIFVI